MLTATRLLYECAGCPGVGGSPAEWFAPASGPCWWCGLPTEDYPRGRRVRSLPDTFPPQPPPACPSSAWLCAACGWTLDDKIAIPGARDAIAKRAALGGRATVSVQGGPTERVLLLTLASGLVGVWTSPGNAASEEAWLAAREALRVEPATVPPCEYRGAVAMDQLGETPSAKFRNYHHLGSAERGWHPLTNADRATIRSWLVDPPAEPWVCAIGDGQKHAVIYAPVSPGRGDELFGRAQSVYFDGAVVDYRPAALADQIAAAEDLIAAGATREEIGAGTYTPRGLALRLAMLTREPVLRPLRGGPVLGLVLFLCRPAKEIRECSTTP